MELNFTIVLRPNLKLNGTIFHGFYLIDRQAFVKTNQKMQKRVYFFLRYDTSNDEIQISTFLLDF